MIHCRYSYSRICRSSSERMMFEAETNCPCPGYIGIINPPVDLERLRICDNFGSEYNTEALQDKHVISKLFIRYPALEFFKLADYGGDYDHDCFIVPKHCNMC